MSEACGRRRLAKLVFATGASGNLRGFLEKSVHASYNYRLTDPFVFHAAFLEKRRADEIDAYQAAAEEAWSNYIEKKSSRHASVLNVAPELLWALDKRDVADVPDLSNWVLGKKLLENWELLELEHKHLKSIKGVSNLADEKANRLNTWKNASEEQKKAAEELIEVARKEVPENPDDEEKLKDEARKAFENSPEPAWVGSMGVPTKREILKNQYGNSEVDWALVTANAEIPKHLRECRAAKVALLKWKTRKADKAFEELDADDTSPETLVELAKETTKKARAEEGCWKTDKAKDDLHAVEKRMWECVEGAEDARRRATEAAESAKNALQRAREASQSAQSVKKSNPPDIRTHAPAESNASWIQPDSRSELTPKPRSVDHSEVRPPALMDTPEEAQVQQTDGLQQAKNSVQHLDTSRTRWQQTKSWQPISVLRPQLKEEMNKSKNTMAPTSPGPAKKQDVPLCEPTIEMIVGIPLLGFIVYAVWKAIRPVSSQNLMAKSAVQNKVKSRAASVTDSDASAVMVEATGIMPKTSHEEGGLCSQLV